MSWMAYTEFFYPGCELQPGYFYLSIPELYYIPEDGACIGAAGIDAYSCLAAGELAHRDVRKRAFTPVIQKWNHADEQRITPTSIY